ncbi:hypothetical protein WOLCODRAFT_123937 [Wolfiporia cocos MD-104 SS10]|uniref:Uncharacterized protein n=1 Tax=Wolfiporia cocos (strain MD-104) TaxID=742152 RepID=A0A2H3K0H9_WOLCO|nr:hypothetical protein WOLCODRAFT_123937 [Wolfiporia cocos MD-104 SS10]
MGEKAMHFATGDSVAKLLDPPPLSFARAPAPGLAYAPFPPAVLEGRGADLGAGFPALTPRCAAPPHPFATHDVREDDWARFVHDVGTAGKLSGTERVVSNVLPTALSMGFVAGMFVTKGIEKHMRGRRAGAVGKLLDAWNQNFFGPRRMYVVLAQGRTAFNGDLNALPPDIAAYGGSQNDNDDSDSDSSSDSSNGSGRDRSRRSREKHEHERRKQRRQEIHDRRQHRREERQKRRSEKHEDKEKFRLVVAYKPY